MKYIYLLNDYLHKFFGKDNRKSNYALPKKILNYRFVSNLRPQKTYPFLIGKYVSPKGKSVVVKVWNGNYKDHNLLNLERESRILKAFTKIANKNKNDTNSLLVVTPKYIGVHKTKTRYALIMEYVGNKRLSFVNDSLKQKKIFVQVLEHLRKFSKSLSNDDLKSIGVKSRFSYLWQLPVIFMLAMKNNQKHRSKLWKAFILFAKYYPKALRSDSRVIVHGDVQVENIHLFKQKVYIFDFEQTRVDHLMSELVTGISRKNPHSINSYIKDTIIALIKSNPDNLPQFIVTGTNHVIHSLSEKIDSESLLHYISVLDFVMKIEKKINKYEK